MFTIYLFCFLLVPFPPPSFLSFSQLIMCLFWLFSPCCFGRPVLYIYWINCLGKISKACISAFLQHFYSSVLLNCESSMCLVKKSNYIFWKWEPSVLWCILPDIFLPVYNLCYNKWYMTHTFENLLFYLMYQIGFRPCQYIFRTTSFSATGQFLSMLYHKLTLTLLIDVLQVIL